jgi:copper(I)-binding protein
MHRRDLLKRIGTGLAVALLFGCQPTPGLEVTDAWVRPPLPGKTVAAGYFTLRNNTDRAVTLVSMSSPDASRVELHTHHLEGDMMRMRKLDELEVASRRRVVLASGGEHLMLFDVGVLSGPVQMTLEFADGTVINTHLDIRNLTP